MSAVKRWTYVAKATVWPKIDGDDWDVADSYGEPVVIACSYGEKRRVIKNKTGNELTAEFVIETEYAAVNEGDLIIIGESDEVTPPAEAREVMAVNRIMDVFDMAADDFVIYT